MKIIYDKSGNIVTYSRSNDDTLIQALLETGRYVVRDAVECPHCHGIGIVPEQDKGG